MVDGEEDGGREVVVETWCCTDVVLVLDLDSQASRRQERPRASTGTEQHRHSSPVTGADLLFRRRQPPLGPSRGAAASCAPSAPVIVPWNLETTRARPEPGSSLLRLPATPALQLPPAPVHPPPRSLSSDSFIFTFVQHF